jgi:hypothetical protein
MAIRVRAAQSVGGPHLSDSSWIDSGESLPFASISATTTLQIFPIQIIPQDTSSQVSGGDSLAFSDAIGRLMGAQIMFPAVGTSGGVAASSTTNLGVAVYRSFGTLSANITNAGGALTSLSVAAPGVNTYLPSGQTFMISVAAGGTSQSWTTTAAVQPGALSIPVSSQTPGSTYAKGQPLVGVVGNSIAFGWLSSGSGTPAFPMNASVVLPANTANTLLNQVADPYGSYLLLQPGDTPCLYCIQGSSTFTVPTGIITTMVE